MASVIEQPPLGNYTTTDASVILGAGIIGLITAYHLSEMIGGPIYVVDPASKVCAGASGQCEGAIGDFGVLNNLSALNELSFKIHQQIAQKYSGKERFGFSGMDVYAPFSDGFNPSDPRLPWPVQEPEDLSKLPHWLRVSKKWEAGLIARQSHAMRLDPRKFCQFLYEECESRHVKFLFNTTSLSLDADQSQQVLNHIEVSTEGSQDPTILPCKNLVIAAGSWSPRVFSQFFPHSRLRIPSAKLQPVQDWIRFKKPNWKPEDDLNGCQQVWLEAVNANLYISTLLGSEMYSAGGLIDLGDLPDSPEKVTTPSDAAAALKNNTADFLTLIPTDTIEVLDRDRAYMPRLTNGLPIMAKAGWDNLFNSKGRAQEDTSSLDYGQQVLSLQPKDIERTVGGVFVTTGHYLDGFALGPASGKVDAQLVTGQATDEDLSKFGFCYFDEEKP